MSRLDRLSDDNARKRRKRTEGVEERAGDRPGGPPLVSSLGNSTVQRLLRSSEVDDDHPAVGGDVEQAIESKRGGGNALDGETQERLGGALQTDLSEVRVHDDAESNELNHAVEADAFTTGNDVFFREGKYQPGSAEGDKLLAHELTHVAQQRGGVAESGEMRVSNPDDAGERQAEAVANDLTGGGSSGAEVAREEVDDEEMAMASPHLDREGLDDEEMAMTSPHLAREGVEDDEELAMASPHFDRAEVEDDEELAMASPHLDRSLEDDPAADRRA